MVTEIPWGDGSGDLIYLTYSASEGDQTVLVSSDPNAGPARTKDITFVSTVGNISRTLTVLQESGMDYVSITWNDTCITFNDTAIAYPYEEQYIVFVDPLVEQICATNWGDGTGIKPSQAAQVTNAQLGTTFRSNTQITSFDELQYFTGITSLANNAFQACTALESIVFPSSLTTIGGQAFQDCSSLTGTIVIPSSVTSIADNTFYNCSGLTSLTLPSHVTSIGRYAFYGCSGLTGNLTIPADVTTLGLQAFKSCSGLTSLSFAQNSSLTTINDRAFEDCSNLTGQLVIPNTVTSIGRNAFANTKFTGHLDFPSGLTTIPIQVIRWSYISSITIPDTVTTISTYAFDQNDSLTFVDIGTGVTYIGTLAFNAAGTSTNKCTYIIRATTPPTLASTNAFTAARINKIYVPDSSLSDYQTANNWSTYASYMDVISNYQ